MRRRFAGSWLVAHVLALALALTACTAQPADDETARAAKVGTGEVRHDLEPLITRFPQLAGAETATWMSGTMGDARVPGPSTYWIDAIVELTETEHAELLKAVPTAEFPLPEDFSPGLHGAIPTGPLLSSSDLDKRFSQGRFVSKVYLATDGRTLILSTLFQ